MSINLDLVRQKIIERKEADLKAERDAQEAKAKAEERTRQRVTAEEALREQRIQARRELADRTTGKVVLEIKSAVVKQPEGSLPGAILLEGSLKSPAKGIDPSVKEIRVAKQTRRPEVLDLVANGTIKAGATVVLDHAVWHPERGYLEALEVRPLTKGYGAEELFVGNPVNVHAVARSLRHPGMLFQNVEILRPLEAKSVRNLEDLATVAREMLTPRDGARPSIIVRYFKADDPADTRSSRLSLPNLEGGGYKDPDEVVVDFLAHTANEQLVTLLDQPHEASGYMCEVIPGDIHLRIVDSGDRSREGFHKAAELANKQGLSDLTREYATFDGRKLTGAFAPSIVTVSSTDGALEFPCRVDSVERLTLKGPMYLPGEIITPNLPTEVAELFERRAASRGYGIGERWLPREPGVQTSEPAEPDGPLLGR